MDKMIIHPHLRHIDLPAVDRVSVAHVFRWLAAGWRDIWRTPFISIGYGVIFACLGYFLVIWAWERTVLAMTLTAGFLLVAPFLALGFYDLSRQLEEGVVRPSLKHTLWPSWRGNAPMIGLFAMMLAFFLSVWERLSAQVVALFLGNVESIEHFARIAISGEHVQFLIVFGVLALALAAIVFSLSVVSLPMLMDRKTDIITALMTSLMVVWNNPLPMLLWAALIVALIAFGYVTYLVGLIFAFPLLGHASWHAYRDLVEREA